MLISLFQETILIFQLVMQNFLKIFSSPKFTKMNFRLLMKNLILRLKRFRKPKHSDHFLFNIKKTYRKFRLTLE